MKNILLRLEDVSCGYRNRTVISGISLELREGEVLGVTGENAAGKTTLLRGLFGADAWIRGLVEWRGRAVNHLRTSEVPVTDATWVLQDRPVFPGLSLREALKVVHRAESGRSVHEAVAELEAINPLRNGLFDRRMDVLSGGERAIASLALGLVNRPKLLGLDEPAANLSTDMQRTVKSLIKEYIAETGSSCIAIEHRSDFLADLVQQALEL